MAQYQSTPSVVTAYKVGNIGPADANGNITINANDPGAAGTIPYVFPQNNLVGFGPADYVVIDKNGVASLMNAIMFEATYQAV